MDMKLFNQYFELIKEYEAELEEFWEEKKLWSHDADTKLIKKIIKLKQAKDKK